MHALVRVMRSKCWLVVEFGYGPAIIVTSPPQGVYVVQVIVPLSVSWLFRHTAQHSVSPGTLSQRVVSQPGCLNKGSLGDHGQFRAASPPQAQWGAAFFMGLLCFAHTQNSSTDKHTHTWVGPGMHAAGGKHGERLCARAANAQRVFCSRSIDKYPDRFFLS